MSRALAAREGAASVNSPMRRTIFMALLAALLLVSRGRARRGHRSRSCATARTTACSRATTPPREMRDARNELPTELDEYSDCRDVLTRAIAAKTAVEQQRRPGSGGSGGGGTAAAAAPAAAATSPAPTAAARPNAPPRRRRDDPRSATGAADPAGLGGARRRPQKQRRDRGRRASKRSRPASRASPPTSAATACPGTLDRRARPCSPRPRSRRRRAPHPHAVASLAAPT